MTNNTIKIFLLTTFFFIFISCKKSKETKENEYENETNQNINGSINVPDKNNIEGEINDLKIGCGFNYNLNKTELKIHYPREREIKVIENIISFSGLPLNFEIYSGDIQNAVATIIDNKRYIIYDPKLLSFTDEYSDSYWSSISILAHEIGHHLSGHTLNNNISNHDIELQADKFSGFVLYKMGATQEQATNAMSLLGSDVDSESHPNKRRRIQSILDGWNEASNQRYSSAIPPPPSDDKSFEKNSYYKNEFTKDDLICPNLLNEENFGGVIEKYNHPLLEGIIIDIENNDPSGGYYDEYCGNNFNNETNPFNKIITIELTQTNPDAFFEEDTKKVGKRYKFFLLNYYNMSSADLSWLEALIVPGRKIKFKSFYFGHGGETIFYIKKMTR